MYNVLKDMSEDGHKMQQVADLIALLKMGDAPSLTQLRNLLGIKINDLAIEIGVSEQTLEFWENGEEQTPSLYSAHWKIKLGSRLNEKIVTYLGTENEELTQKYWALIWELVDKETLRN